MSEFKNLDVTCPKSLRNFSDVAIKLALESSDMDERKSLIQQAKNLIDTALQIETDDAKKIHNQYMEAILTFESMVIPYTSELRK